MKQAVQLLDETFGTVDFISETVPFVSSDYYAPEMGEGLLRRWVSHLDLVEPDHLAGIKLTTNALERDLAAEDGRRRVNLDPGILSKERLVLATGKNAPHRIYLSGGVYADLTLVYEKGEFKAQPWTYPDYAASPLPEMLKLVRKKYLGQLKEER